MSTLSSLDRNASVARIVLDHPECARVLREHRIDFCCRGELSVWTACAGRGLDAAGVFADLEQAIAQRAEPDGDPRALSTPDLVERIVSRHHAFLRRTLPFVEQLSRKVARVHGDHNRKLPTLADVVLELREMLEPHLDDEERTLFPALVAPRADLARVSNELRTMRKEHLRVGEALTRMRTLADDYAIPDWACGSYRTLMRELETIETDTFAHVHVENHVLMPRFAPLDEAARPAACVD